MGRIGKVIKSYIAKLSGSSTDAQHSSVEEFAGDQRTVQIFGPCNEDFAPPENCKTLNIPLGRGRGFLVSVAYHNQKIAPVAIHGERRLYSTNQAGDTIMTEVFLKQDGTLLIKNDNASIAITPAGAINIISTGNTEITSAKTIINNDIDIIGSLSVSTKIDSPIIDAATSLIVNSKEMSGHTHPQGVDSASDVQQNTGGPI